jgi:hypothetical protein
MVPASAGSRLGQEAYLRWLRAAKVSSLLRDKLAERFAKCRSEALFNGSSARSALRTRPAIYVSVRFRGFDNTRLLFPMIYPYRATFRHRRQSNRKQVLVSQRYSSL